MTRDRTSNIELPMVDLSPACMGNCNRKKEETLKLLSAFTDLGFCLVKGLVGYDAGELLKWTKWFFNTVPEEEKIKQLATRAFNPANRNVYRGYFPLVPKQLSHKQGYDLGPKDFTGEEVGNPFTESTPRLVLPGREKEISQFYEVMYRHRDIVHAAADLIMSLIAEAGEENSGFFNSMFSNGPMHTFRPLKYPKRMKEDIPAGAYLPDGRIQSTPAHMDSGFLTLLQTFGFSGLEIQLANEWKGVAPNFSKNVLVVNLGEQMTEMSNGRFKSTIHRVVDIGQDRYSIPFFYEPSHSTNINTKIPHKLLPPPPPVMDDLAKTKDMVIPFGAFLLNKLPIYAEYERICDHLPDWMKREYVDKFRGVGCWAKKTGIEVDGKVEEDNK